MFLYYTRGLVRWEGGVQCGDLGAMKAEGQARLEPPRNPGYAHTGYGVLAEGYVESGVVGSFQGADGNGVRGVMSVGCLHSGRGTRTTEGQFSFRRMRAALFLGCCFATDRGALAFCLLRCCCAALPCPLTTGEQTGQRPSPLLMLTLCSCHCPQSLVARYPRSSGSTVMLWAT